MAFKFNPLTGKLDSDSGITEGSADTRYVNVTGDTMTGALTFQHSTPSTPLILNNNAADGTEALKNEILFKPQNQTYSYGIVSWYCEDYIVKDVIMQAHRAHYQTGSTSAHRHFSIYTTNAARDSTVKRLNIPYMVDYAQWDIQNSYVRIDSPGNNIGLSVVTDGSTVNGLAVQNTNSTATGALLSLNHSGAGAAISAITASTTNAAINMSAKFGYSHSMTANGGYGLQLLSGSKTLSSSNGLALFQHTNVADSAGVVNIDNRSGGKSLVFKNNSTEYLNVGSTGVLTFATDTTLSRSGAGTLAINGYLTVTDEAYGAGWDGDLSVPTKNAVYDKIETVTGGTTSTPSFSRTFAFMGA